MSPFICDKCKALLEENENLHARHLSLIGSKEYETCTNGGLMKPSFTLVEAVGLFEATFQTHIQASLRKENIRQHFKTKRLNLPCSQRLKSPDCHCHTADYIASLFLTVRIHHELKLRNAAPKKRLHKQVPKLKKLLHC